MIKKIFFGIIICILIIGGVVYWKYFRGAGPAVLPPPGNIVELLENKNTGSPSTQPSQGSGGQASSGSGSAGVKPAQNSTGFPLKLPDGFSISVFAKNLNKPRVLRQDSQGNLWVSEIGAGAVTRIEIQSGKAQRQERAFTDLKRPHGLAFDPNDSSMLYIAEEHRIIRTDISPFLTNFAMAKNVSNDIRQLLDESIEHVIDLPVGGRHFSRTIEFGQDGRLYVAIGSSCDTCHEEDERRAAIYSLKRDGSDFKLFAKGLRNTVFFTWREDGKMWGTDMGRDFLGDNLPPDEVNIIEADRSYGWPVCYGKNIHDTVFDKNTYIRNPCMEPFETPSHINLPAHIAPLGLTFIPPTPSGSGQATNSSWPKEYWGDLLIAYHGSWNSSKPVGYKVVRVKLDEAGGLEGTEDFISGWLTSKGSPRFAGEAGALGRPVDLLALPDGTLYISDDHAGVVYKVEND